MHRNMIGLLLAFSLASLSSYAQANQNKVFFDSEFTPGNWLLTVMTNHPECKALVEQVSGGGNPGAYRRIRHELPAASPNFSPRVVTLHRRLGANHHPALDGPIEHVCFDEDVKVAQGFGDGQGTGPVLWQDGRIYVDGSGFTGAPSSWTHRSFTVHMQDDFYELSTDFRTDQNSHPDFSPSGDVIEFGFLRANSSKTSGFVLDAGIDNWRIELNCGDTLLPTPSATPTHVVSRTPSATPKTVELTPEATATTTGTPSATSAATSTTEHTVEPSPSATQTPTPTPSFTPTVSPSPTSVTKECICSEVLSRVPRAVVVSALAEPHRTLGWRRRLNPNKPIGPDNPLRECLSLVNPANRYHPVWNGLVWSVGCR